MMKKGWEQKTPIRFHSGYMDELRDGFLLTARVPLPEMPDFFPAGAEGELSFQGRHVLHLDTALRGQPLFSHLEKLNALVRQVADRKLAFPEFLADLDRIPIPAAWRDEIVNGLFDHAGPGASPAPDPKPPGLTSDLDRLLGMLHDEETGGSKLSPHLGRFLEEVGRDSTGFTLRDGAARQLQKDLLQTLESLRGSLLRHGELSQALGFMSSVQRLARGAKGRERQTVHLWSEIPGDPASVLLGENADEGADYAVAVVLLDPTDRDPGFNRALAGMAASLRCPLLVQVPGEEIPAGDTVDSLGQNPDRKGIFFFAGGVASRVEGENCVFRPAALAFLEGLVASRENMDFYRHRAMVLEDQDVVTEKGQARASDRLLDQTQVEALAGLKINRVNGARNRSTAAFPLIAPWEDS